ncbi:MAG: HIT family protein [Deltaproteobacteria bacterium]|nr:HIT family protein [Candidatus Zymogenaceae bacterium]
MDERLFTTKHAFSCLDRHPVAQGHILVIPVRHVASWFGLNRKERAAMLETLDRAKGYLDDRFSPDGYTIGVNEGAAAGQTIFHVHLHLIPRYVHDVENPLGGIRGVIPGKQLYPDRLSDD